jgi:hypothetical protein
VSEPAPRERSDEDYRPGTLARILAVPLLPFVAAWEAGGAVVHGLRVGLVWSLKGIWRLLGKLLHGVGVLLSWGARLIRFAFQLALRPLSLLVHAVASAALHMATAIAPILIRSWLVLRGLIKALMFALRAFWARLRVPLRLLALAMVAVLVRVGVLMRAVARAAWLAICAVASRIAIPLRLALRALGALAVRLALIARATARVVFRVARALARILWTWVFSPIGRGLTAVVRTALWLVRLIGHGLYVAASIAARLLAPVGAAMVRGISAVGGLLSAAARLAWGPVRALMALLGTALEQGVRAAAAVVALALRPLVQAWRQAFRVFAAACGYAFATLRASMRTALFAVHQVMHDTRNQVRHLFGRPALPMPVLKPESHHSSVHLDHTVTRRHAQHPRTKASRAAWAWAGAVAIVMVVVVGVLVSAARAQPGAGGAAVTIARPQEVTSSCPLLRPGGPASTFGDPDCGNLAIGHVVAAFDCSSQSRLPHELQFTSYDTTSGKEMAGASLSLAAAACRVDAGGYKEGSISSAQPVADDLLLLADFVPPSSGHFSLGLAARCSDTACVNAGADGDGHAWLAERSGGEWTTREWRSVQLQQGQKNRLAMWIGGNLEMAWLNGQVIGATNIPTGKPAGVAEFWVVNDGAGAPVALALQEVVVLDLRP